ncbi:MAG: MBL fold metallo-hydrolase [Planctomycetes bacterium]|nr:MBL fold metallo-hydrolase [Planctomycetota bacterium]
MNIKTLIVGPIQACCYIASGQGSEAIMIDPGGDGSIIIDYLKKHRLKPIYLVNTHGHIDHIGANGEIKESFPDIKICIHADDAPMLGSAQHNLSTELGYRYSSPPPDKLLKEGDIITVGKIRLEVIHLPGHTKGGVGLVYEPPDKKSPIIIFTGDTLFAGGIGRTDFPGGSNEKLLQSIKTKILTLPADTIIYPGHGPDSTVGEEKDNNPFLS